MAKKYDPNHLSTNEQLALDFINSRDVTTVMELKALFEGNQPLASSIGYTLARKGKVRKEIKYLKQDWGGYKHLKPLAHYYPLNKQA